MKKSEMILMIMVFVLGGTFAFEIFFTRKAMHKHATFIVERDSTIASLVSQSRDLTYKLNASEELIYEKDSMLEQTIVLYAQEKQRADRQAAQAVKLAESHAREQRELQDRIDACSADLAQVTATCDTLSADLAESQRLSSTRLTLVNAYLQYVTDLEPHLIWLQNEAERNWWKKFWDRGKLPKPATPFPQPPALPATY